MTRNGTTIGQGIVQQMGQLSKDMGLLNTFTHGDENSTVELGGVETRTIKNLVAHLIDVAEKIGMGDLPTASPEVKGLVNSGGNNGELFGTIGNQYKMIPRVELLASAMLAGLVPAFSGNNLKLIVNEHGKMEWREANSLTNEPTPNTIMCRDTAGRVRAEDPVHDKDVANKKYVDNSLIWVTTGSITLNGTTDNTVVMTDIVPELGLEVGDVIRIDAGAYNKLHTVESITDNSSIIVNYEHAGNRANGSLKLPDFTGQATVTRIAKWFNAPTGLGQAWVNLVSSRSVDVSYSYIENRAFAVSMNAHDPDAKIFEFKIDGEIQNNVGKGSKDVSYYQLIPSGSSYAFNIAPFHPYLMELR